MTFKHTYFLPFAKHEVSEFFCRR